MQQVKIAPQLKCEDRKNRGRLMENRDKIESRTKSEIITTQLPNGAKVLVQATVVGGREQVVSGIHSFQDVNDAIEGIAESVIAIWEKVKPNKASVEFGVQIGFESGKLTAMLVKGSGSADLKVTMEWEKEPHQ
jgi:hypothetical protein